VHFRDPEGTPEDEDNDDDSVGDDEEEETSVISRCSGHIERAESESRVLQATLKAQMSEQRVQADRKRVTERVRERLHATPRWFDGTQAIALLASGREAKATLCPGLRRVKKQPALTGPQGQLEQYHCSRNSGKKEGTRKL
jgi:hypothetical protein